MLEEQRYILTQICAIAKDRVPDGIIIAGDVYDKSNPSAEAMTLFSTFLSELSSLGKSIFVISGNHDSAERISYMNPLLASAHIYMSPIYDGSIKPLTLEDEYGVVNLYLLPFIKPAVVRHYLEDSQKEKIDSYNAAIRKVVDIMDVDESKRNILVAHQFITSAQRSDSEDVMVGGLDNVDASTFDVFDYVALGHLHRPQYCSRPEVRYCGSPLKYSFSEVNDSKSVTFIEMGPKGQINIDLVPLSPLHDWHDLKGTYEQITSRDFYLGKNIQEDFVRITLTDEEDVPDAISKLRIIYHNIMELRYDNKRTRAGVSYISGADDIDHKTPQELFDDLFFRQNDEHMSQAQSRFLDDLVEKIMDDNR